MNNFSVYAHISPNNKVYIGVTKSKNPENRWGKNGNGYKTQRLFWRAIQKYGWDNFKHVIIVTGLSEKLAYLIEIELIKKFQSNNDKYGYNLASGGGGASGYKFTQEQCDALSRRMIGHVVSEETKRKIGEANKIALKGRKLSPELCKQISERNKGKKHPHTVEQDRLQSERLKGNKLHLGYKASEESRQKMRESHLGYKPTKEAIEKTVIGRKKYFEEHPEKELERREKIRQAHLGKKKGKWSDDARRAHMEAIKRRRKSKLQN